MRVTMRRCVRRRCYSLVVEQKRRSMVIYKCPLTWVLEIINGEPGREFFGRRTWTNIGTYVSVCVCGLYVHVCSLLGSNQERDAVL